MSVDLEAPSAFQQNLQSIYGGELVGRNHTADEIRRLAESSLRSSSSLTRLPSGNFIWLSERAFAGQVLGEDVEYTLASMANGGRFRRSREKIGNQAINLCMNQEWGRPAAIILPTESKESSAAVIVGDAVNSPDQLSEIKNIVFKIYCGGAYRT